MIRLIAFFGNPGYKYAHNRHNAPWLFTTALPFYESLSWQNKYKGQYAALDSQQILSVAQTLTAEGPSAIQADEDMSDRFHFLMPETFMNNSGDSVSAAASFFKINLDEILIVHDELEIPLGTLSLKFSGGLGGHNGLRSMRGCFGSADFWRLRIGIGRPNHNDIYNWVLSDFTDDELETLLPTFDAGADLLLRVLTGKPEKLLPTWAKKKVVLPAEKLSEEKQAEEKQNEAGGENGNQ